MFFKIDYVETRSRERVVQVLEDPRIAKSHLAWLYAEHGGPRFVGLPQTVGQVCEISCRDGTQIAVSALLRPWD